MKGRCLRCCGTEQRGREGESIERERERAMEGETRMERGRFVRHGSSPFLPF